MTLRVVGAGLGRTGTLSLKAALEQLLGGRCYHMFETMDRPDDGLVWTDAAQGRMPDWGAFLAGYVATVDWPACSFWRELADANPDALVLLSVRASAEEWWTSASGTIFATMRDGSAGLPPDDWRRPFIEAVFTPDFLDADTAMAEYEAHNARVRAGVPRDRLLEWCTGDGWDPICVALGLPVPDEPFPHVNSTADFRVMIEEMGRAHE
jgi:hypothetical protein